MSRGDTPSVRRMRTDDLGPVAELTAAAFSRELDDEIAERRWRERIAHPFSTDPDGAFVAELNGRVIGVAQGMVRRSVLVVAPDPRRLGRGLVASLRRQVEQLVVSHSGLEPAGGRDVGPVHGPV